MVSTLGSILVSLTVNHFFVFFSEIFSEIFSASKLRWSLDSNNASACIINLKEILYQILRGMWLTNLLLTFVNNMRIHTQTDTRHIIRFPLHWVRRNNSKRFSVQFWFSVSYQIEFQWNCQSYFSIHLIFSSDRSSSIANRRLFVYIIFNINRPKMMA